MDGEEFHDLTPFGRALPLIRAMTLSELLTAADDPLIAAATEWLVQQVLDQNPEDGCC